MPPLRKERRGPDALAASGRATALALCIALAGCQSNGPHQELDSRRFVELNATIETEPEWITEAPVRVEHEDVWDRVREGFALQEHLDANPRVEQQRLLFANNTKTVEIACERSAPYLHYIVEQLEARDMPLELALLPVIESAYNPFAYSPAHAVGLWQFIPSTGLHFNLRQTRWYDGRRDIVASTNAALSYLTRLHEMFNGDWLLALAAYNAGEGTVSRAVERNQRDGLRTDYWNLRLPRETQDYVPKLLAVSQLVKTPTAYGIALGPVANEPYFETIALKHRMDLARVAALAELDEDELYQLNPAFTRRVTLDGPLQLLVPQDKAEMLEASLALMKPQELVDWQEYRVRPGDSLGAIANRYNLTVTTLRDINRLRTDRLDIGQVLSIPASAGGTRQALHAVARNTATAPRNYRVREGDSLWTIARANDVSVADLQRWNQLSGSALTVGQALFLQGPAGGTAATKQPATYYKVKRGDSLYAIAKRFNVGLGSLKRWNPSSGRMLKPGQTLTLYLPR